LILVVLLQQHRRVKLEELASQFPQKILERKSPEEVTKISLVTTPNN
jgi:hypothetical protein